MHHQLPAHLSHLNHLANQHMTNHLNAGANQMNPLGQHHLANSHHNSLLSPMSSLLASQQHQQAAVHQAPTSSSSSSLSDTQANQARRSASGSPQQRAGNEPASQPASPASANSLIQVGGGPSTSSERYPGSEHQLVPPPLPSHLDLFSAGAAANHYLAAGSNGAFSSPYHAHPFFAAYAAAAASAARHHHQHQVAAAAASQAANPSAGSLEFAYQFLARRAADEAAAAAALGSTSEPEARPAEQVGDRQARARAGSSTASEPIDDDDCESVLSEQQPDSPLRSPSPNSSCDAEDVKSKVEK